VVKTVEKTRVVRKPWTTAEVRELKILADARSGKTAIAKKLNRTPGAVGVYAMRLGISLSTR
jgi:hypothetical protein